MSQHKRRGEWAELAFMARAASLGFTISKPLGECARYDVILEKHGITRRVQVKSVSTMIQDVYRIWTASGPNLDHKYTLADTDLLVAYIIPLDTWYIFPVEAISSKRVIAVRPHRYSKSQHFEFFREAWHLLEPVPALVLP